MLGGCSRLHCIVPLVEGTAELERAIITQDPARSHADDGESILMRTVTAATRTSARSQLESVTALLPVLAVSGSVDLGPISPLPTDLAQAFSL